MVSAASLSKFLTMKPEQEKFGAGLMVSLWLGEHVVPYLSVLLPRIQYPPRILILASHLSKVGKCLTISFFENKPCSLNHRRWPSCSCSYFWARGYLWSSLGSFQSALSELVSRRRVWDWVVTSGQAFTFAYVSLPYLSQIACQHKPESLSLYPRTSSRSRMILREQVRARP